MDEIARGVIQIEARDEGALASLRRIETQFDRTMADIDRQEAEVRLLANSAQFGKEVKKAKAELDELRKAKAEAKIDADTRPLDRKIRQLERDLAFINRQKAKVNIDVDTAAVKKAKSEIAGLSQLEERRNAAEAKYASQRDAALNKEARRRKSLSDQMTREMASDESAARRMDSQRDRDLVKVTQLQREYARLSDRIEGLSKRHAFTSEARVKLELDQRDAIAKMLLVKAELNRMGGHPPVGIKTEINRSDMNLIQRFGANMGDVVRKVAQGASGLSTMTIRFGPFTASIKQAIVATAVLGPIITDLLGGATALAGVLGTALAGSMSIAGGLAAGMVTNFGGMFASIHPLITEYKTASQATAAYNKAVLKFGQNSKQAKTAHDQMNQALKGVSPVVAQAARGMSRASIEWQKLTGRTTRTDIGHTLTAGFKALDAVMPVVARNSNRSMTLISNEAQHVFRSMQTDAKSAGGGMIGSLGRSFNAFLAPALDGITHLGAAFIHIGESAARIFGGRVGQSFNQWAQNIDNATKPGTKLDATITRLGNHARDVGRLFMDFGRLMTTVFNGGANSGDKLVNQLDHAFRSWNQFLKSGQGQKSMATFFQRSTASVSSLAGALAPIAAAIGDWSNLLSPFTHGILDVIAFVSRLFLGLTKVVGLGGPLTALGATFATLFAVGKLASFVAMLSRVVSLVREAYAVAKGGEILGGLKTFTGGIGGALKGGAGASGILAAHEEGSVAVRTAILEAFAQGSAEASAALRAGEIEGGTVAAAEERTAIAEGGVAGGAGGLLGGVKGLGSKLGGALGLGTMAEEAGGATSAVTGLGAAVGITGVAIVGTAAAAYGLYKAFGQSKTAAEQATQTMNHASQTSLTATHQYNQLRAGISDVGSSYAHTRLNVMEAKKALDSTKKGTLEHTQAELDYRDALRANITARNQWITQSHKLQAAANTEATSAQHAVDQNQRAIGELKAEIASDPTGMKAKLLGPQLRQLEAEHGQLAATASAAWNRVAAAPDNAARAYRGMIELTGASEQAVGKLARAGNQKLALKISTKFDDPGKVQRVAQTAQKALGAGVTQKQVLKIVTDSSSAEQAIRRINAAVIKNKRLVVTAADSASATIRKILGIPLPSRNIKIAASAAAAVAATAKATSAIRSIPGSHNTHITGTERDLLSAAGRSVGAIHGIPSGHNTNISATGNVVAAAHAAADALNAIPRNINAAVHATVDIATHRHSAQGGVSTPQEKALIRASNKSSVTTHGGRYSAPTLLVGEEDRPEYVIATNPAYRRNNLDYLAEAAGALGMMVIEAAAGGRGHAHSAGKKKKKDTPSRGGRGAPSGTPRPHLDYVSTDSATADYISQFRADSDKNLNDAYDKIKNDSAKINALVKSWHRAKTGTAQRNIASKIKTTRTELQSTQHRLPHLRDVDNLARGWYQTSADLQNRIGSDTSKMNKDAATYNHTGDQTVLGDWNTVRGDREDALRQLRDLYGLVKGAAPPQYQSDLQKGYDSADSDLTDSQYEAPPTVQAPVQPTLDDFITARGLGGQLADLVKNYALAQTNNVADDPATIYTNENVNSLKDDLTAAGGLMSFYTGLLGQVQNDPSQPASVITEAANAMTQARDTYFGLNDQVNAPNGGAVTTTGAQMIALSQAREDLYNQFSGNISSPVWAQRTPAAAFPPPAPGAYGTNPSTNSNTPPTPTVVNQTINMSEPPPDPHTWSQGVAWELQAAL